MENDLGSVFESGTYDRFVYCDALGIWNVEGVTELIHGVECSHVLLFECVVFCFCSRRKSLMHLNLSTSVTTLVTFR